MRRARLGRRLGRRGGLVRIEAVHARAQLPVLVPQFPIRFGEPFQASGQAPRFEERGDGDENGRTGKQPQ
jgi:hypothetical protein